MLGYRSVWRNTAVNGLKNEGRQWPLNRVLFFPVVYPFEGRSALQGVISEVVFFGRAEKWGFGRYEGGAGHGKVRLSLQVRVGIVGIMLGKCRDCRVYFFFKKIYQPAQRAFATVRGMGLSQSFRAR